MVLLLLVIVLIVVLLLMEMSFGFAVRLRLLLILIRGASVVRLGSVETLIHGSRSDFRHWSLFIIGVVARSVVCVRSIMIIVGASILIHHHLR